MMELYLQVVGGSKESFAVLRSSETLPFRNTIKLKKKERAALSALLSGLAPDLKAPRALSSEIIVPKKIRTVPSSLDQARFVIPASPMILRSRESSLTTRDCARCALPPRNGKFQSVLPVKASFPLLKKPL